MPNVYFVDTNVFLYANDPSLPRKQALARTWLAELAQRNLVVISPQVMNEFISSSVRKMAHISPAELSALVDDLRIWCSAETSSETAVRGLLLHRRYGFAFYDSVLIASALMRGCDIFLSEDMAHGQRIDRLQIVNPFAVAPSELLTS